MLNFFRFSVFSALLGAIFANSLCAQGSKPIPSEKPKLIVTITVTQFRHDYISRFWDKFSDDGFRRLVNRGTYCRNTNYNYLISDKGVGTATIVTGTNPSRHGIVGENWYNDLKGQVVTSIFDQSAKTIGGPFDAGQYSPQQLLSTTFADELNLSNNFKSKVISVSLEPVSAVISGGHTAKAAYWFEVQGGNFITSSFYADSLPLWVVDFNNRRFPDIYMEKTWSTMLPLAEYTESLPDQNPYEQGYKNSVVFPYEIKDIAKIYKKREEYSILKTTPFGDNLVKDFAIQAIVNENLGAGPHTDVLFLNFTALEEIGNMFGQLSVEVEDAVLRLDRELAHFFSFIESTVGIENTLVVFVAEHGLNHKPEYLEAHKIPSGYFNSASAISLLSSYMNNIYGKGDWIKQYHAQQIYLNRTLIESAKLSLSSVQENVANLMLQFQGVQNTITSTALTNTSYVNGVFRKIQNGYNQKRSGDVLIHLADGYVEKHGKNIVSFGTDTRVPLVFYGWKIGRKTITRPVDLTDIAPTISVLLDISYPNSSSGVPVSEIIAP
ncbi:MAG: alkaline phosphatase family protein [Bacteroidales bacterium]|nr:alkaline phosphatase family protein [Bacteroidales bacterium]